MKKYIVYCILCIVLCFIFVSCRTVKNESKQHEKIVVQSLPYCYWGVQQNQWPFQHYWYWWSADILDVKDFVIYDEQVKQIEQYQAESEQMKKAIARLETEIEHLKSELKSRETWVDFWRKVKVEDPSGFQAFDEKLTELVEQYPREARYLTIEELQTIWKQIDYDS